MLNIDDKVLIRVQQIESNELIKPHIVVEGKVMQQIPIPNSLVDVQMGGDFFLYKIFVPSRGAYIVPESSIVKFPETWR